LRRKLQEARVTEIWFAADFDTGKMLAGRCGPVPDDLLRKECSRSGRKLWSESFGGSPAREVVAVCNAPALAARLKQKPPKELPEKDKIGTRWADLVELVEHPDRLVLARKVVSRIEQSQSTMTGAAGKIYRWSSPEAIRVLDTCAGLAGELQRPPTRKELMEAVDWRGGIKEFTNLLRDVGLAWLKEDHKAKGKR
jgi:hypothetical protein